MKYEVVTDRNGYCVFIRHTGTKLDFVELDLSKYDFTDGRMSAYKLGKDELIFDESKWREMSKNKIKEDDKVEIVTLKQRLLETDYIAAKWLEEIISLDNPLTWIRDVIAINIKYSKEYRDTIRKRKLWRKRIKELEG